MSALWESPFFGVTLTILAYWAGCKIQKRTGLVICNGLVLAVMMIIAVLAVFDIPYAAYNAGGSLINLFLGPATVCLAVTIYAQIDPLKKNLLPFLAGVIPAEGFAIPFFNANPMVMMILPAGGFLMLGFIFAAIQKIMAGKEDK